MILIFQNLLRLFEWPNIRPILENVPCALEINLYSAAIWWNVLYMSLRFGWLLFFTSSVSLLIFCLVDLSIT